MHLASTVILFFLSFFLLDRSRATSDEFKINLSSTSFLSPCSVSKIRCERDQSGSVEC